MKIGKVNVMGLPTSFICFINMFEKSFKYGDGAKGCDYVRTTAESLCRIL
jgi:hypothetical protein